MKAGRIRSAASFTARLPSLLLFVLCAAWWPTLSHAACSLGSGGVTPITVNLPATVTIPRDAPVGTVIASGYGARIPFNPSNPTGGYCTTAATAVLGSTIGGPPVNGVYPTSIPGIGWKLTNGSGTVMNPLTVSLPSNYFNGPSVNCATTRCYAEMANDAYIYLIKTGPITGGYTVPGGVWFSMTLDGLTVATIGVSNPIQVTGQTCTVTTPSITVDLGSVPLTTFSGVGTTSSNVPFQIGLNCTGVTTSVGITFTDAHAPGNRTSTLSLGPASTAGGVGIQILAPGSTLVQYGADSSDAGNAGQIMLGVITDASTNLMFNGRYVQTATTVTPGSAVGRATFTMSYQ